MLQLKRRTGKPAVREVPKRNKFEFMSQLFILILTFQFSAVSIYADFGNSNVLVNQIGYLPLADKVATVITDSKTRLKWELREADTKKAVQTGDTDLYGKDLASGDQIQKVNFSGYTKPGSYILWVEGVGESVPFVIGKDIYPNLPKEAMAYFYFHRLGVDIEPQYLEDPAHAHTALHPGDSAVPFYKNWSQGTLNVKYSWADAGDFGIYPVNQGISAWTLLNLYERYPEVFPDGSLNIPEKANKIPDILDEVRFGSTFMEGMLPEKGLASHKVHNDLWSAFPLTEADILLENSTPRFAQPPSTNATYAVARNLAHLARLFAKYDNDYAKRVWNIAKTAWSRAESLPVVLYTSYTPDSNGGGDYGDANYQDDRYAAAVEMYLTAYQFKDANQKTYQNMAASSTYYKKISLFDWAEVATLGTLSLLSAENDLSPDDIKEMKQNLLNYAANLLKVMKGEGYPVPLPGKTPYSWGSNSFIVNEMILMGYAYDISNDKAYLKAMFSCMDYLMGNNAMKISYITGYGEYYETDTHDRWAFGRYYFKKVPYPKGWLSGGPNNALINDASTPKDKPAAKSYAEKDSAPTAWCSKENAINWNAPLVWVAQYLNIKKGALCQ